MIRSIHQAQTRLCWKLAFEQKSKVGQQIIQLKKSDLLPPSLSPFGVVQMHISINLHYYVYHDTYVYIYIYILKYIYIYICIYYYESTAWAIQSAQQGG